MLHAKYGESAYRKSALSYPSCLFFATYIDSNSGSYAPCLILST